MKPPKDVSPSDLFAKLLERPRPHKVVDFPRWDDEGNPIAQVAIWVMTQEEQIACASAAEQRTREMLKRSGGDIPKSDESRRGYDDVYSNLAANEILSRVCRDPNDLKKPFFPNAAAVMKLTADEVGVLMDEFNHVQATCGPIISYLTDDEFEAWVSVLAEGAGRFPFARCSLAVKTELLERMAKELVKLRTPSTSSLKPASDSTDTE